ncbi:hypothetical protein [Maridesulfovibrio bastinii]|uniref:hypothetical protein n=1 Tax=Maridesulfovibrio bastinii TaxID=47157 RepID=UPI0004109582|nr:hypothetical protein [Maridesulfovibrio bastinii]
MSQNKKNPQQSVRAHCLWCMGGSPALVRECPDEKCQFFSLRGPRPEDEQRVYLRAIRRFCLCCTVGDRSAVRECPEKDCALHRYRFGILPKTLKLHRKRKQEKKYIMLPGIEFSKK